MAFFDRLGGLFASGPEFSGRDRENIAAQGLLNLGAGLLSTKGGFGNALASGLQGGLLSMQDSTNGLINDRYRKAMMQRTMAGMDRNNQLQELAGRAVKDGQLDQSVYPQLAALDPEYAKNLRSAIEGQRKPLRLTEMTDPRNPANVISVLTDDEGTILYPDKTPVDFGGGGSQAVPPGGPLSGVSPGPSASDIGIFKPEQVQSQFTQLASIFPGTQISSRMRTPEHNRAVGGVANSQHIRGTAADFVVPAQARPDFIQRAKGMGFQALDEGDHVHLELPGSGGARQQVAQQGNRFSRPRYAPTSTASRERYRTLSAEDVQRLGLPQGTVAQEGPSGQVQIINKPRDLPTGGQVIDNGDGTTTFIPAGKITEGERNAAGFYQRMVEANGMMNNLEDQGYDPTSLRDFATTGSTWTNFAATPEGQQYYQAAMNWVRANLRKESGAAIGVDEAKQEIRNYFPRPGDSEEVIAQKSQMRHTVENAMRTAAGGALPPPNTGRSAAPASQRQGGPKRLKYNPKTGKIE